MTAKKLHLLILALGACGSGLVNAGSGDITGREAEASVELSNLGEPDAAVVVAAPAKSAAVAPAAASAAVPTTAAIAPPPMLPRAARQKGKSVEDSDDASANPTSREGTDVARTQADGTTAADGAQSAPRPDWAVQQPYASSAIGVAPVGATPGAGSPSLAGTPAAPSGAPASGSGTSGSGTQGNGTQSTGGSGQASSVLDSPELLAQRLAQYRQLMLNEPLGQNGLAANPAVQRRYLMINRTGYMGNFQ
jgi:hypothetical protein